MVLPKQDERTKDGRRVMVPAEYQVMRSHEFASDDQAVEIFSATRQRQDSGEVIILSNFDDNIEE